MSPSELRTSVFLIGVLFAQGASAVEHFGLSQYDNALLCMRERLGKPVLTDAFAEVGDIVAGVVVPPCCRTAESCRDELRAKRIRMIESGDWACLIAEKRFDFSLWPVSERTDADKPIAWKRLEIVTEIEHFQLNPGSRHLTPEEEKVVSAEVLRNMRMVPKYIGSKADQTDLYGRPSPDGETAVLEVTLWLDAHRLAPTLPESVIAFLAKGMYGGPGRLAYGEIRDGKYEMLWDSPMFMAWSLGLGYNDVDGDGVQEIVVGNWYGNGQANAMSIFRRDGTELTRTECDEHVQEYELYTGRAGVTCPVVGTEITIDDPVNGKKDLIVREYTAEKPRTLRYRLQAGHYVKVVPSPSRRPARTPRPN